MNIYMILDLYNLITLVDVDGEFKTETVDGECSIDFSGDDEFQEKLISRCINSLRQHYHIEELKIHFIYDKNSEIGKLLLNLLSLDDKVEVTSNTIEFCVEKFLNSVLNNEISKVLTKDQIMSIKNAGINFDYANYGLEKKGNNYVLRKDSFSLTALTLSSCFDPDNYIPLDLFVGYCSHFC